MGDFFCARAKAKMLVAIPNRFTFMQVFTGASHFVSR
jgi:hypothetical protein